MKRFYAWLAGLAGGAAVYRAFRRQPPVAEPDPADELKTKLAEARAAGDGRDEAPDPDPDVDARRRSVHERARTAIDEMKGD
jgi:hypothetical protein